MAIEMIPPADGNSISDIMDEFGVGRSVVRNWITRGKLAATKEYGKYWSVKDEDLVRFALSIGRPDVVERLEAKMKIREDFHARHNLPVERVV